MTQLEFIAKKAGIIGAGGAGFPTYMKLAKPVRNIIVNGAECEPLMHGDQQTMEARAEDMIFALEKVADDFSARLKEKVRVVVGIKGKYKNAIKAIETAINGNGFEILEIPNVYPAGDEQFLVYEATGNITPEGGIPPMVDCLVMNVGTLVHLADAIKGKPVTKRMMTIGGAIENPQVVNAPIGTPFSEIVKRMEPSIVDYVLLVNGPMMGRISEDLSEVTTKTMGGLFLLPKKHSHVYRMRRPLTTEIKLSKAACEVCRYCTDFCPRFLQGHDLEPHKIMRVINYDQDMDTKTITSAWACCECGLCDLWACPMSLSPRVIYKEFKKRMKEAGIKNPFHNAELTIDPARKFRGVPTGRLTARLGMTQYDIRPPYNENRIEPKTVRILLGQHIGAVAIPTVKVGQRVEEGALIADIPEGQLGAAYHASIAGKVGTITTNAITIERAN